jgi:hypothetical protein
MNYYSAEDVKELVNTFTSWIGKEASLGNGTKGVLKSIEVKESKVSKGINPNQKYAVHFKFLNKQKFSANEFLSANGLDTVRFNLPSYRSNVA